VPARDEEEEIGKGDVVGQPRRQRMAFEVVDREEGQAARGGDALRRHHADDHAADQARPRRRRDAVEIAEPESGLLERAPDDAVDRLQMGAGRDLWHDAAVGAVFLQLGIDDVRADGARIVDDRRRGLVAARLDAENDHGAGRAAGPAEIIRVSDGVENGAIGSVQVPVSAEI
jgi:hypothetical protein